MDACASFYESVSSHGICGSFQYSAGVFTMPDGSNVRSRVRVVHLPWFRSSTLSHLGSVCAGGRMGCDVRLADVWNGPAPVREHATAFQLRFHGADCVIFSAFRSLSKPCWLPSQGVRDAAHSPFIIRSPAFYGPKMATWLGQGGMGRSETAGEDEDHVVSLSGWRRQRLAEEILPAFHRSTSLCGSHHRTALSAS